MRKFSMADTKSRNGVIGLRVRAAREERGLSQEEIGHRLGLTKGGYGQYERGLHPFTADQLFQLSALLNRSVAYFLGLETGLTPDEDQLVSLYRRARTMGLDELFVRMAEAIVGQKQ
jgi:transcriptional regulator with XRE-family HTH domain